MREITSSVQVVLAPHCNGYQKAQPLSVLPTVYFAVRDFRRLPKRDGEQGPRPGP